MDISITAIGTANPVYKSPQHKTAELISAGVNLTPAEKRVLRSVYNATGIEYRHSVLSDYCNTPDEFQFFPNDPSAPFPTTAARMQVYKENALPLSLKAVNNCLSLLDDFDKNSITHIITVSCTGMYAPGIDIELVNQLKLRSTVKRTAINFMGCYGAFNGMRVAESICKADPSANVLVVCIELCTIHFQKSMTMENIVSNSIFADGAAAVLIQANPQCKKHLSIERFHCDLLPQTNDEMAWHVGDNGFDIVLSAYVPEAIESGISKFTAAMLEQDQLNLLDIDFFAIHPDGIKILHACEKSLGITEEHNKYSYHVLRQYGNMSSATVLFVLKAIWDDLTQQNHNKKIFSCAFGPGLTLESMILKTNV